MADEKKSRPLWAVFLIIVSALVTIVQPETFILTLPLLAVLIDIR